MRVIRKPFFVRFSLTSYSNHCSVCVQVSMPDIFLAYVWLNSLTYKNIIPLSWLKQVVLKNSKAEFDGTGYLKIDFYNGNEFTRGLTVAMTVEEAVAPTPRRQVLLSNCQSFVMPSLEIALDPVSSTVVFTVDVSSSSAVNVSVPYTVRQPCQSRDTVFDSITTSLPSRDVFSKQQISYKQSWQSAMLVPVMLLNVWDNLRDRYFHMFIGK